MALTSILRKLPSYAKDVKFELDQIFYHSKFHDLSDEQLYSVALAICYSLKHEQLINAFRYEAKLYIDDLNIEVIKGASSIMSMYNVFYRTTKESSDHAIADAEMLLSDTTTQNPGIDKATYNMCQLAISALNHCSFCVDFYTNKLIGKSIPQSTIINIIRLVSVLKAVSDVLEIEVIRNYDFIPRGESI
ncbi:MAG: carboxymuconolactone decarboxylase family protein [Alphaproteobacteria bacterium]|jgi:alkyl hydroperoxide reductase subunit D|nr:carboxymuconolactone decarboxylase family protein [Candidatus Jidaibacter sp.]